MRYRDEIIMHLFVLSSALFLFWLLTYVVLPYAIEGGVVLGGVLK